MAILCPQAGFAALATNLSNWRAFCTKRAQFKVSFALKNSGQTDLNHHLLAEPDLGFWPLGANFWPNRTWVSDPKSQNFGRRQPWPPKG
jgi:hypothetical protein